MKKIARDLLSSRKFVTALIAVASIIGARYGLDMSEELTALIGAIFAVLIGAQGAADHGKEAARLASGPITIVGAPVAGELPPVSGTIESAP